MKSAIISLLFLTKHSFSSGTHWDYDHMSDWSHSFSMCDNQDESPINIQSADAYYDSDICSPYFDWDIEPVTDFKVTNNGHALVLKPIAASNIDPLGELDSTLFDTDGTEYHTLALSDNTIAKFENYFAPADSPHTEFCLDSLHFHWGQTDDEGSEHKLDGHQYALECHFVHFSCQHSSLGSTLEQFPTEQNVTAMDAAGEDSHQLGVVGIFFDVIEDEDYVNAAFEALLTDDILAAVALPAHDDQMVHGFDLTALIPGDVEIAGYFAYQGSLTTPPCTDIVRWYVMNARGSIGISQLARFRELYAEADEQNAPNFRNVQEDNPNTVYGCMEAPDLSAELAAEKTTRAVVWAVAVIAMITPIVMGVACCYKAKKEMRNVGDGKVVK
jgi:carbonic anhydrase